MFIIERMFDIMNTKKIKSSELAEYLNINKSVISNWKSRNTNPPSEYLVHICKFLNISVQYLLTGKENSVDTLAVDKQSVVTVDTLYDSFQKLKDKHKERVLERIETYIEEYKNDEDDNQTSYVRENNILYMSKYKKDPDNDDNIDRINKYPVYKYGRISAGEGIDAIEDKELIYAPVKCDLALEVYGDSMEPLFKNKQIIYIRQQPDVENGQIAAVIVDDIFPTAYLKKVYHQDANIRLSSINKSYDDLLIPAKNIRILGKVVDC